VGFAAGAPPTALGLEPPLLLVVLVADDVGTVAGEPPIESVGVPLRSAGPVSAAQAQAAWTRVAMVKTFSFVVCFFMVLTFSGL